MTFSAMPLKILPLSLLITLPFSIIANAEEKDSIALAWFDHFTFSLPYTVAGIILGTGEFIGASIQKGKLTTLKLDSTGKQIKVGGSLFFPHYSYSTGAIHHSAYDNSVLDEHEFAHSVQTALMGPLQLPLVVASYLSAPNRELSLVEDWADVWRKLEGTFAKNQKLELRLGLKNENGASMGVLKFEYTPIEKSSQVHGWNMDGTQNHKNYGDYYRLRIAYLTTQVELAGQTGGDPDVCSIGSVCIPKIGVSVLERDFDTRIALFSKFLAVMLDSRQTAGKLTIDGQRREIDVTFLSHFVGVGAQFGHPSSVALELFARSGGAVLGALNLGNSANMRRQGVIFLAGYEGEAKLRVFRAIELYLRHEEDIGTLGYTRAETDVGLRSEPNFFRYDPDNVPSGLSTTPTEKPVRVYGGVEFSNLNEGRETNDGGTQERKIKALLFTFGGRF